MYTKKEMEAMRDDSYENGFTDGVRAGFYTVIATVVVIGVIWFLCKITVGI